MYVCHTWITVCSHAASMMLSINSAVNPPVPSIMWERIHQTIVDKISTHWQRLPVKVIYIVGMLLMLNSIKYPQIVLRSGSLVKATLHMYRTSKLAMASFHSIHCNLHGTPPKYSGCVASTASRFTSSEDSMATDSPFTNISPEIPSFTTATLTHSSLQRYVTLVGRYSKATAPAPLSKVNRSCIEGREEVRRCTGTSIVMQQQLTQQRGLRTLLFPGNINEMDHIP